MTEGAQRRAHLAGEFRAAARRGALLHIPQRCVRPTRARCSPASQGRVNEDCNAPVGVHSKIAKGDAALTASWLSAAPIRGSPLRPACVSSEQGPCRLLGVFLVFAGSFRFVERKEK
jgi:hypothetical protein